MEIRQRSCCQAHDKVCDPRRCDFKPYRCKECGQMGDKFRYCRECANELGAYWDLVSDVGDYGDSA